MNKKIIVVYGGSFNPPLNSHFSLSEEILNEYNVEKVIFVPVNKLYNKPELIENEHRYNMLKLVCDKNKKFEVSDVEIKEKRQLYTIETLEIIQKQYPNNIIWFAIGSDNLKELKTWKNAKELLKKYTAIILPRDNDNIEQIIKQDTFLNENKNSFMELQNAVRIKLSSSFIRERIKQNKSIRYLTPDEVYLYIKENGLY